jgi:hydrogenase-4 component B
MNAFPIVELYMAGLAALLLGALSGIVFSGRAGLAVRIGCSFSVLGAVLELVASGASLLGRPAEWVIASGIPLFECRLALDPLSSFFTITLSAVALAVSVYSFGYLADGGYRLNLPVLIFLYNALLLGLSVSFTAANAFLFLIAWEIQALAAYALVTLDHKRPENQNAGLLYVIMAHADAGCLMAGFALLGGSSRSLNFSDLRDASATLHGPQQALAFGLFLLGFGIKAGIVPLHIWLPAAHPVAPSNVSALLSGVVIKAGIYGMVRVFLEFLGGLPAWMGMTVIAAAVVSAVLGVLYALMEHDLKRLLAYHSIENIGIILLGLGAAMMFRTAGHPQLAALAVIACLFHTLNHAVFKCLLFLGAGSVLYSTHVRNMEELGGLIRRMPWTAFSFLIGAIAISGLPPLNGFVSEWLTYQSLLAGFGATKGLVSLMFPVAGSLLALTGALAAACFVKAFGITFLALPRSEHAESAAEAPRAMLAGMGILTFACFGLGLGASWILPAFDAITRSLVGAAPGGETSTLGGLVLAAGARRSGTVSTAALGLLLLSVGSVPALLAWRRRRRACGGPAWDCGLPGLGPENEYTATAFSKPLRMVFAALYQPRREIQAVFDISPYFPKSIRFESEIESTFENRLYRPLQSLVYWASARMRAIQAGSVHLYLAYIFVTLILLLLFAVRP